MARKHFLIDQGQAAYLLGVDSRTIQTWAKRGTSPLPIAKPGKRGQRHRYDPHQVMQWFLENEISKLGIEDGEILDLNNERAKLARLQARKVGLELAEREGMLIQIEGLGVKLDQVFMNVQSHFLALPSKAAPYVHGCKTVSDTTEEIRKHVYEALTDLATLPAEQLFEKAAK